MSKQYVIKSFMWGAGAKIFDALVKFISVPLLLSYFGKAEFGLIALATSVNAYLQLLDMGVNLGGVKFFSQWIAERKYSLLDSVARTSILFYSLIGAINTFVLVFVAVVGMFVFELSDEQRTTLRILLYILASFAIVNWSTSVFNQLLTANKELNFTQKISFIRTLCCLLTIYLTIWLKLDITIYFVLFCLSNSFIVIPYYLKSKSSGLITSIYPKNDWINFSIIFKYSLAIVAMGVFQMSATKLRPIILGIFSSDVITVVTEYRIMETITLFIISIGGMFISIFLPMTSNLVLEKDHEKVKVFAYKATLFTSIVCCFLCFPFVVGGKELLILYVGKDYLDLYNWLLLWIFIILFYLHNSPVASLVLATGKTGMLVFSSALSCIVSLFINALFVDRFGVGSAILGYGIYIIMQMSFYYFYYNNKILNLDSLKVFKSFVYPTVLGLVCCLIVSYIFSDLGGHVNNYLSFTIKSIIWSLLYILTIILFKVIKLSELRGLLKRTVS